MATSSGASVPDNTIRILKFGRDGKETFSVLGPKASSFWSTRFGKIIGKCVPTLHLMNLKTGIDAISRHVDAVSRQVLPQGEQAGSSSLKPLSEGEKDEKIHQLMVLTTDLHKATFSLKPAEGSSSQKPMPAPTEAKASDSQLSKTGSVHSILIATTDKAHTVFTNFLGGGFKGMPLDSWHTYFTMKAEKAISELKAKSPQATDQEIIAKFVEWEKELKSRLGQWENWVQEEIRQMRLRLNDAFPHEEDSLLESFLQSMISDKSELGLTALKDRCSRQGQERARSIAKLDLSKSSEKLTSEIKEFDRELQASRAMGSDYEKAMKKDFVKTLQQELSAQIQKILSEKLELHSISKMSDVFSGISTILIAMDELVTRGFIDEAEVTGVVALMA